MDREERELKKEGAMIRLGGQGQNGERVNRTEGERERERDFQKLFINTKAQTMPVKNILTHHTKVQKDLAHTLFVE